MGQKIHPIGFRLGTTTEWTSKWFAKRGFHQLLKQDVEVKKYIKTKLRAAAIARVEVERSGNAVTVTIVTAKPGIVIGRGGAGVEDLKKSLSKFFKGDIKFRVNIQEVSNPSLVAQLVVQNMIEQLEKRLPFRRILKQSIEQVKKGGGQGVKVMVAGRLNGADIARTESLSWGKLPLQTLRADVDFGRGAALTTYGMIGVKVWIYRGEIFHKKAEDKE
ncbi:MAG: 30S ribosomal protein S3 [Candidatus Kerfeldbacteria bacterium CG08_land_8_20_14_0_20_43_14]|uniref:Small ribosomal subunit protein uS3 n=1 Tax=Candidatus Kerfeldbacteria bacterium CG08_land_8_20_14_0_20_43_14 TaxID=2014246 RepID=A0A2H0YPR2_9BACT|nr:MAG: 30S ribosomal protein S3 [Candidatus Kerfeldbacteria bacterium CG08_land_8_20_14_0_20_43_14]